MFYKYEIVIEIIGKNTWKIGENCIIIIKRHTRSLQLQQPCLVKSGSTLRRASFRPSP